MSTFVVVSFTGHRIHWLCDFDYIFCITACIYPSMINYMFRKWILYYIILYFCVRIYYIFSEKYTILYYIILYFDFQKKVVTLDGEAAAAEAAAEEGKFTFLLRICLRFILGLRYFTQGNLGTFSRIPSFCFFKIFKFDPPRSLFDLTF